MILSSTQDLRASLLLHWRVWLHLGVRDIRSRYRRTVIGPFWTVLSTGIMVGALGLTYALLWRMPINEFLPYFTRGYIVWFMFMSIVAESCSAFIGAEAIIRSLSLPYLIHILRVIWRNVLVFFHSLVIYILVIAAVKFWPGMTLLWLPVSLFLVAVNAFWIGILVAIVCARFRDVLPMVTSLLQILFFITPVFWPVERLDPNPVAKFILSTANLAYHLVEVVRAPLGGEMPPKQTLIILVALGVIGNIVMLRFFDRYRTRVAYWL